VVDSVDDQVIEESDIAADGSYQYGGYDKVYASVSIARLADFVEAADLADVSTAISIVGNDLDNHLVGNSFNNTLDGGAGNDFLDGVTGSDTLIGGVGDDTYKVNGDDVIIEVTGPAGGVDTVISTTNFSLNDSLENLVLGGADAISGFGTGISNALTGNSNANRLEGQGGHDTLTGGGGADTLVGGAGDDVYHVNTTGITLIEAVGGGIDEVNFSDLQNVDLQSFVDANGVVQDIENASISAATFDAALATAKYSLRGNDLANVLTGSFNDDTLSGRKGNDTLDGGFGNDLVTGDEGDDTLFESAGLDTLEGGIGNDVYVLSDRTAVLTDVSGTDEIRILGGGDLYILDTAFENLSVRLDDLADQAAWLAGNGLSNKLTGGQGDDTLSGLSGNDTMNGLEGSDHLMGGFGNDLLAGGAGDDLVQGQGDADTLIESEGLDTLEGGAGDDVYVLSNLSAQITEFNETGIDEVRVLGGSTYTLGSFIEKLSVRSDVAAQYAVGSTLTGNTLANTLTGGLGKDSLSGGDNNDTLHGLDGADTLNGGLGADSLDGGTGGDIYLVDNVNDIVNDSGWTTNGEIDEVRSDVSYTLTDGNRVENLVLNAGSAKTAVGNFLDNWLQGNAIANLIQGLGGADTLWGGNDGAVLDTLEGGSGADTYILSNNADKITEVNEANVIDTVVLAGATSVTLGNYVENADARPSTVGVTINGNSAANGIIGSNFADVLAGGAGNDRYLGGGGNDTITDTGVNALGATSNDAYGWGRGAAADTLKDSGGTDTLEITGAVATQVWFAKSGTDLKVSLIGTNDAFLIKSWYGSASGATANGSGVVESLVLKDVTGADRTLSSSAVQSLVTAMAKFSAPALGTTSLPASYGTVATAVATAWV
jgi:Ca2+-binding RTX toxin-like protein